MVRGLLSIGQEEIPEVLRSMMEVHLKKSFLALKIASIVLMLRNSL